MSTLRISNIEAKSVPASATVDEKVKITNSSGDTLVFIDGKTSGITTVGINTTDSNITFDANSNVVVTGIITATKFSGQFEPTSVGIADSIFHTGDDNTSIRFPAADTITAETGGGERLRITSDGKVGINSTNPAYKLDVYTTSGASIIAKSAHSTHSTANIWCNNDTANWLALGVWGSAANTSGLITANDAIVGSNNDLSLYTTNASGNIKFGAGSGYGEKMRLDSSGRLMIGNTNAATMYQDGGDDLVIGNTTGSHGMTILSANNNRGRIMFGDTYTSGTGTYAGQILYDHGSETMNFYANHTNNSDVKMQLGGSNNQLFVGITKGSTTTYDNRSAYFHNEGGATSGNFISITTASSEIAGIVFGDSIANNTANYESYMYHDNATNDFWIRVNAGSDSRHLKIKQGGNVEIGNGNLVLADGHGIDFSADSNASGATSELLDDYETGTWTPNVVGSSGSDAWSYRRAGKYTKIGNKVTASWSLGQYNGNLSGTVYIDNLPFVVDFRQYGGDTGLYYVNTPSGTIIGYFVYLPPNATQVRPYWSRSGQQGTPMDASDLRGSNQTFWEGNVTYYTNS